VPLRGEVWWADLDPVVGRELGYKIRPVLILSNDRVNTTPTRRVVVVPGTTVRHPAAYQVAWTFRYPRRGLQTGYFSCLDVRSIAVERLTGPFLPPSGRALRVAPETTRACLATLAELLEMRSGG
jgi:mRNA-degrading endonuclease toxin of MazEF toxin-antitoxin module